VPPTEVIPILDRYLMFYIRTADKLQRTARWLESLPGGIKYLREVILEDKLDINASLEAQMQELVDSFFDEWAEAINNPSIAAKFKQFANTAETVENMELEQDRTQTRPVMWPKDAPNEDFAGLRSRWSQTTWQPVLEASYFAGADALPNGISATIKRGDTQLAVWRFKGRYYATQQMCPHKRAFILADGLVGEDPPSCPASASTTSSDTTTPPQTPPQASPNSPWISCPHHKRNFDLTSGACKSDATLSIATFDVEERPDGMVYLRLPPVDELDAALGTRRWMVKKGEAGPGQFAEVDKKIGFVGRRAKKPGVKPVGPGGGALGAVRKGVELMAVGGGCGAAPEW
jgi:nitrite reductase (NAD(P)H)